MQHFFMSQARRLLPILLLSSVVAGPAVAENLVDTADKSGTFKSFVSALRKSGLQETLKEPGPYTVFAPTDEAIARYGTDRWAALGKDKVKLAQVLSQHVLPGKILITEVKPGPAKTLEGASVKLKSDNGKVTVGEANVTQSDISADNGVIHAIDRVLEVE